MKMIPDWILFSVDILTLEPGEFKLVKTGIKIALPEHTEAQIRPRSGLAYKNGITVLNTPGTIDQGYRGEIGVILINHSKKNISHHRRDENCPDGYYAGIEAPCGGIRKIVRHRTGERGDLAPQVISDLIV